MKTRTLQTAVVLLALSGTAALADSLSATYYTMPTTDPDAQNAVAYTVQNTLGPNGLPVVVGTPGLNDVNAQGEITWWNASMDTNLVLEGTGTITLPFDSDHMYVPEGTGTNDSSAFLTAEFTGTLNVPTDESVDFHLGSDDDSFLYIDGTLVSSVPGIHADASAPVSTQVLTAGSHTLDLFYADREHTGAALTLTLDTTGVNVGPSGPSTAVPEPATWLLLGFGLAGLAFLRKRRRA